MFHCVYFFSRKIKTHKRRIHIRSEMNRILIIPMIKLFNSILVVNGVLILVIQYFRFFWFWLKFRRKPFIINLYLQLIFIYLFEASNYFYEFGGRMIRDVWLRRIPEVTISFCRESWWYFIIYVLVWNPLSTASPYLIRNNDLSVTN